MFSINIATVGGNINNPELKYSAGGTAILTFSLATSRGVKKGEQFEDVTTWHNIVMFGRKAEVIGKILAKGMKVTVTGRIDNRSWVKEDGSKGYASEIVAEHVVVSGKKTEGSGSSEPMTTTSEPVTADDGEIKLEDIPF